MRLRLGIGALLLLALLARAAAARGADGGPRPAQPAAALPPTTQPSSQPAPQPSSQASSQPSSQPAAPARLPDWAPKISARVQPAAALIGDPITVTISVRHRQGVTVNLPLTLDLGKFSELSREDGTRALGAQGQIPDVERTFVLRVAAYELGEHTLPPLEVTALGPRGELITLTTAAVPIRIRSVLRNEPNPKPKALEPPTSVFQRTWWLLYLIIGVAAAGVIAAATLLVSRHLRARREALRPPPPPVPAHVVALGRLALVDVEGLLAAEQYKELYLLLSEIMRDFVGRRWGFDALEMTTTEIGESLAAHAVSAATCARLDRYLQSCDLVKFAKYRPDPAGARAAHVEAAQLVRETAIAAPSPIVPRGPSGFTPGQGGHVAAPDPGAPPAAVAPSPTSAPSPTVEGSAPSSAAAAGNDDVPTPPPRNDHEG